jgi:molecular chaperone IbpA
MIHQGIAERQWSQKFFLGEYMEVTGATMKDGLLTITVERQLPEELKPKTIKIK